MKINSMLKIDLGSGRSKLPGYTTLDNDPSVGADIVADMTEGLPFEDESVDEIRCFHILEHIETKFKVFVMAEMYRVLRPGGILHIELPIAGSAQSYMDPTHVSFWNRESFWYFEKDNRFRDGFAARYSQHNVPEFIVLEEELRNDWALNIKMKKDD